MNLDGDPQNATVSLATKDGENILSTMHVRLERNGDGHAQSDVVRAVLQAEEGDIVDLRCTTFNGVASDAVLMTVPFDDMVTGIPMDDEDNGRGGFVTQRLPSLSGHQVVFGAVALYNGDGDNQDVTAQLLAGPNASLIDETFVNLASDSAAVISTQGILQSAAALDVVELDWNGFLRFKNPREDASLVVIAADRVNGRSLAPPGLKSLPLGARTPPQELLEYETVDMFLWTLETAVD